MVDEREYALVELEHALTIVIDNEIIIPHINLCRTGFMGQGFIEFNYKYKGKNFCVEEDMIYDGTSTESAINSIKSFAIKTLKEGKSGYISKHK